MSTPIRWEDHVTEQLVITAPALELMAQHGDKPISASIWRAYQAHGAEAGLIPGQKAKLGGTALYDAGEVVYWAKNRLGRGARSDLTTPSQA